MNSGGFNLVFGTISNRPAGVVLGALRFSDEGRVGLDSLTETDWRQALSYCDRNQLTLVLRRVVEQHTAPQWIRERLDGDAARNRERFAATLRLYSDLQARFHDSGLEHIVLKGFAQWPYFTPDPASRTQYDLDLFFPESAVAKAREVVAALGYEPIESFDGLPTDHLPTMIRKTGWRWRGDYFDPEIPVGIELHFRFWDRQTERFGPARLDGFWERRDERAWEAIPLPALAATDALAYSCLHALRHLLRGDARPYHIYEIAWFLDREQSDEFWRTWGTLHDEGLQQIQAICFRLAREWFGCRVAPAAQESIERLSRGVNQWFERFAYSLLESQFRPNKDELWLHLSLLSSARDKAAVLRRRLAPLRLPGPVDAVHVPDSEKTLELRLRAHWRYLAHLASRFVHHVRSLAQLGAGAPRWWAAGIGLPSGFWLFLCTAAVFNFGLFVFFLLYNLYLLDAGFAEDFVGLITAAATAGSIAGSLIGGALVTRIGLRASLLVCFSATAVVSASRVLAPSPTWLLASAFLAGVCTCIWFVSVPLVVAQLTNQRNRPTAFSLTLGSGIGLGVLAGLIGGKLPALVGSTRNALFIACGVALCAVVPAAQLRLGAACQERRTFSRNPFLARFLIALALWGLATGAFNPFFNVYFSRVYGAGVERIGWIFSASQLGQVAAILCAPILFRRFGLAPAVAMTQVATACALAGLGATPAAAASLLYVAYMSFQYMGEPGMYSLLMNRLPPGDRTGASSLNFFVLFGTHALAASLSGVVITRFGYPPLLFAAAALALVAAILVRTLLREPSPEASGADTAPACS